ncbi:MAG TPA: hypothetical protein VMZ27_03350 [Candidatus Saccharimonadales bacterium]|nr:hypothetical protein [Candidatus Saccharimonadales bacterium]
MKLVVVGRYEGTKVLNWPLAMLWVFLVGLAAALGGLLIYVLLDNAGILSRAEIDLLWLQSVLVPLAMIVGGILPLWLRWRRPLDQLPSLENAPSPLLVLTPVPFKVLLQKALFGAVCLATLIALFYAVESWRGRHAFMKHKQTVEAKGQSLDWKAFVPPAIPNEQNLAMTPLFKGLLDLQRTPRGIVWGDQSGVERLKKVEKIFRDTGKNKMPGSGNLEKNQLISIPDYQKYFQNNTNVPHAPNAQTPAEDVLFALSGFEPELKEIKAAAGTYSLTRFPIRYEDNMGCLLPHLARIKPVVHYLNAHAIASLEAGRTQDAFEDLKLSYRLTDIFKDEPFVISHLVRIACASMSTQIVKEGLARHQWSVEQLEWIQDYCAKCDLLGSIAKSLQAERAFCITGLDMLRRGEIPLLVILGVEQDNSPFSGFLHSPFAKLIPKGWYYQNMLSVSEFHAKYLQTSIMPDQHRVDPAQAEAVDPAIKQIRTTPYNVFAKLVTPALINISIRAARWQTALDHATIACALEKYRLAQQHYPESLDALQPQFIAKLPSDVITGNAYHYQKTETDYLLYSVGWNGKDDGGQVGATASGNNVDGKKGDWVWSLTPTPPVKLK